MIWSPAPAREESVTSGTMLHGRRLVAIKVTGAVTLLINVICSWIRLRYFRIIVLNDSSRGFTKNPVFSIGWDLGFPCLCSFLCTLMAYAYVYELRRDLFWYRRLFNKMCTALILLFIYAFALITYGIALFVVYDPEEIRDYSGMDKRTMRSRLPFDIVDFLSLGIAIVVCIVTLFRPVVAGLCMTSEDSNVVVENRTGNMYRTVIDHPTSRRLLALRLATMAAIVYFSLVVTYCAMASDKVHCLFQ